MGIDTKLNINSFNNGKTFITKLWNCARCIISKNNRTIINNPTSINKWIVSRLHQTINQLNQYLNNYQFHEYAIKLYDFVWNEFGNFYLEITKFYSDDMTLSTLNDVFSSILKMAHPLIPFVTEKIWKLMYNKSILTERWPLVNNDHIDTFLEINIKNIQELLTHIRNIKKNFKGHLELLIDGDILLSELDYIKRLVTMRDHSQFTLITSLDPHKSYIRHNLNFATIHYHLIPLTQ